MKRHNNSMRMVLLGIAIAVLGTLISFGFIANESLVYAQTTGTITGTVTYYDGTALSGASVTSTNGDDSTTATDTTDSSGAFSISSLAAGTDYSIAVTYGTTSSALSSTSVSSLTVVAGQTTDISTAIKLGGNGWIACDSVVTTNCVQSLQDENGTDITTARAEPYLMGTSVILVPVYGVSGGLTYTSNVNNKHRELADYSLSTSSTLVIKILLGTFQPKAIMARGANLQSWSYDSSSTLFTITVKPTNISYALSPNTCDASTCANQADIDYSAYAFLAAADMSDMPDLPANMADFVSKVEGVYISTNGQYVTMPQPNSSAKFTFSVGAPHLKLDGTLNNGGFFKLWMPNDLLEYMWDANTNNIRAFNSSVDGSASSLTFTETTNNGRAGVLMEQTDISYSVKNVVVNPTTNNPTVSEIGLAILAGLFALMLVWTIQRKRRRADLIGRR